MSSWLIRLSRKHYCNSKTFCTFYDLQDLLKSSLDINSNTSQIQSKLNIEFEIPHTVIDKIPSFEWKKGQSDWLIEPNRKGQSIFNGFTKFCPECIRKKGFYQLKWKLNLFYGCVDCLCYLLSSCPHCKRDVSPIKSDNKYPVKENLNPLYLCWYCEFDLRKSKSIKMNPQEVELLFNIDRSYNEDPINLRYLTFLQFGIIEVNGNHTL